VIYPAGMIRLVRDGAPRPLTAPGALPLPGRPRRGRPFRVLVLGGARSGKSVTAERMLAQRERVDYVACGPAADGTDPAWAERVRLHRERRPAHWTTVETLDVAGLLAEAPPARQAVPVLVDCLSTWLAGVMDECGLWTAADGADKRVASRVDALLDAWRSTRRQVVAVSNEVGSGIVPATVSGGRFRDELGTLNARIAAECEQVWLCVAGIPRRIR
jgi:adenosylcobinamide kinase/adenosylcobinamide-phosphate guanylyltransferase